MEIEVAKGRIEEHASDAIVVNLFEGVTAPSGATGSVDKALGGEITAVIGAGDLTGKLGESVVLYGRGRTQAPRVVVVGLGPAAGFGLEEVRRASGAAVRAVQRLGVRRIATVVHGAGIGGLDPAEAAQATAEGAALAGYTFTEYKSADRDAAKDVASLALVEVDGERLAAVERGATVARAVIAGSVLARDLANHPSNTATPTFLAGQAAEIASRHGMRLEVWDDAEIARRDMGALASVAAGSDEPARFIILEHAPGSTAQQKPHVLVGKGITFDTGGISLKPGLRMGAMKYDMAGAAAVLGTMEAVGRLGLERHVVALVAATENMPSGHATKPGDIVRARNGTTIEILNTDAEGRLVLADALAYAAEFEPATVVDIATLTGAIVVALGKQAAGLFSNDDALADALVGHGARTGERLWRLPTWPAYDAMIKSDVADIKNTADKSPSPAGSIFGAKFLERFVQYPWAHVDIAGVAWDAEDVPYLPKHGSTAFGVRLFVDWLRHADGPS
jgi:leucyl aminopeptidase